MIVNDGERPVKLLTTAELARLTGLQPTHLLAIARRRLIAPARTIGRTHMWYESDASRFKTRVYRRKQGASQDKSPDTSTPPPSTPQ